MLRPVPLVPRALWLPCVAVLGALTAFLFAGSSHAYKLLGAYFDADNGPVVYYLHDAGSEDISDGSDLDALRSAFRSWACVPGSRLRVVEASEPGPNVLSLEDGVNTAFWDETGAYMLGPSTLGVTVGDAAQDPEQPIIRYNADIVFNGFDHEWRTNPSSPGVDVESVAVHEIGHFFGLGHPCEDEAETVCLGPEESVMTPQLPDGAIIRTPFQDDKDGIIAIYPQDEDDDSTCDGPFRQGEACACNDECIGGLRCTLGDGQETPVCTPNCGGSESVCPNGFACVLAARPEGQDDAEGACVAVNAEGKRPPAAVCERDTDCAEGLCLADSVVGRRICQTSCDTAADCPDGYACTEELCTGAGATDGIACPSMEPDPEPMVTCACAAPGKTSALSGLAVLGLFGALSSFRGRNRRR